MIAVSPHRADATRIDDLLCAAAQLALPLGPMEPTNSAAEKDRVAANPRYNPQFTYQPQDCEQLKRALESLSSLEVRATGVERVFEEARTYLIKRLVLRLHLGDDEHWTSPLYPPAPMTVRTLARGILADPATGPDTAKRPFHAQHLVKLIQARFREYGISDWTVQAKANLSSTNTDPANRVVNVRADSPYSLEEMKRLVVHEVDTHVLRAANGALQPYRIFGVGAMPSYLMTEEGLAVINEERMGYVDMPRTRLFAGRVLAATRAIEAPFAEVYTEQRDHGFSHDEAFLTAKRVKRGIHDTANPGGFLKDQAYLWGRMLVEEYVLAGGDLARLYVGKLAVEHLPLVDELGLVPSRYMPLPYI